MTQAAEIKELKKQHKYVSHLFFFFATCRSVTFALILREKTKEWLSCVGLYFYIVLQR